jgi:hypothetical protein
MQIQHPTVKLFSCCFPILGGHSCKKHSPKVGINLEKGLRSFFITSMQANHPKFSTSSAESSRLDPYSDMTAQRSTNFNKLFLDTSH